MIKLWLFENIVNYLQLFEGDLQLFDIANVLPA